MADPSVDCTGAIVVVFETRFKSTIRFLLAALLALPGGGFTEMHHAHPGGGQRHNHPRIAGYDPHSQHDSEADYEWCKSNAAGSCPSIANCIPHAHVTCFGIQFTCPSPSDEPETDHGSPGLTVAKSLGIMTPLAPAPSVATEFVLYVDNDVVRYKEVTEPASARFCRMPAVTYLCDTARHERSGVQLI